jgi:YggT family protein
VVVIDLVITLLTIAIFAKVILSFIIPMAGASPHPLLISINHLVNQITEPILGPIRRLLPTFGMFDFSPTVALVILWLIRSVVADRL